MLPSRGRHTVLALGSAALLPATLLTWLTLEISAFAMIYLPGMAGGSFRFTGGLPGQAGTAYYFSAGDITSLTFGDVVARTGTYRALTDVETVIGLATVGLAVTYVLAALDALASLNRLHGRVRRQAIEPSRPATIVARYFHGGQLALADQYTTTLARLQRSFVGAPHDPAFSRCRLMASGRTFSQPAGAPSSRR